MIFEIGEWFMRNGKIAVLDYIGEYNPGKPLKQQERIKGIFNSAHHEWYANGRYFLEHNTDFDLMEPVPKEKTGFNFQPGDERYVDPAMYNDIKSIDYKIGYTQPSEAEENISEKIADEQWRRALAHDAMRGLVRVPHEWKRNPIKLADMAFEIADAMIARGKV